MANLNPMRSDPFAQSPQQRAPQSQRGRAGNQTGKSVAPVVVAAGIGAAGSLLGGLLSKKKPPPENPNIGLGAALNPRSPLNTLFDQITAQRLRQVSALGRSATQQAIEEGNDRHGGGLLLNRQSAILNAQQQAASQAFAGGAQLKAGAIQSALDFERKKALANLQADLNSVPWYASALPSIGNSIGLYLGLQGLSANAQTAQNINMQDSIPQGIPGLSPGTPYYGGGTNV
jgi:hypothetical protein